ncbi:phytanoyl-CoA dioxygenase family protein [Frateuria aurantia]
MPTTAQRLLRSTMLSPVWLASVLTGAKSFVDNPLLGSRRLNQAGLHAGRVRLAHALARQRRQRLQSLVAAADRETFEQQGFVVRQQALPATEFALLRQEILGQAFPSREMLQGDAVTRRIAVNPAFLERAPVTRAFLQGPLWNGLCHYVGSYRQTPMAYVQTILSHVPGHRDADPQLQLHADTFHPTVKAWLFLEDVAEEDGPFCYVPGSHRLTPRRLAWEQARSEQVDQLDRLSSRGSLRASAEALEEMGLPAPIRMAVPANTLVVADTFGFHARGPASRPSRRVELWGYGRRNPFLPWSGFDLGSLPWIAPRRIDSYWRYLSFCEQRLHRQVAWRDVGLQFAGAHSSSFG